MWLTAAVNRRDLARWSPYAVFFVLWLIEGAAMWQHWPSAVRVALWVAMGGALLAVRVNNARRHRPLRRGHGK